MRPIKFRVWSPKFKTMSFFNLLPEEGKNTQETYVYSETIVMQFTGLLDRNGKEIYEGDVVHYNSDMRELTGAIEYDSEAGAFKIAKNYFTWFNPNAAEVLGNIYENPELIK